MAAVRNCLERRLCALLEEVKEVAGSECASLFFLEGQELLSSANSAGKVLRIPAHSGIAGHVARTGEPAMVPDAYKDARFNPAVDMETGFRTRSVLCVPLQGVQGVLQLVNKSSRGFCGLCLWPESFTENELGLAQRYASRVAALRAQDQAQLERRRAACCLDAWDGDTLGLERPLASVSELALERLGLDLDGAKLRRFLTEVERGYAAQSDPEVAYHNVAHAASVVAFASRLLQAGLGKRLRPVQRLALVLAAVVHDLEHPGLSNAFLVKNQDPRALRHEKHANEQHHLAAAFALLARPELDFLQPLGPVGKAEVRAIVTDLVLATDMAESNGILARFKEALQAETVSLLLQMQMALKCADLGHLALPWEAHLAWVQRLETEFFTQGDKEKRLGFEVSFLMDRQKPGVSETQTGFFDFVVLPLFSSLVAGLPEAAPMLDAVQSNQRRWQAIEQKSQQSRQST